MSSAGVYLLRHWQLNHQDKYWRELRPLMRSAAVRDEPELLANPYLTLLHMMALEESGSGGGEESAAGRSTGRSGLASSVHM
jgi:hypothetical protein